MPALNRDTSALLLIDFQSRLMLAIADGPAVVANAKRLLVVPFIQVSPGFREPAPDWQGSGLKAEAGIHCCRSRAAPLLATSESNARRRGKRFLRRGQELGSASDERKKPT